MPFLRAVSARRELGHGVLVVFNLTNALLLTIIIAILLAYVTDLETNSFLLFVLCDVVVSWCVRLYGGLKMSLYSKKGKCWC